jgi:hypothetical protein
LPELRSSLDPTLRAAREELGESQTETVDEQQSLREPAEALERQRQVTKSQKL